MPLEKQQIEHVARLARLKLSPQEIEKLSADLTEIVGYFEQIQDIDTSEIEAHIGQSGAGNRLRDDKVGPSLPREEALKNAPSTDGRFFLVPKVIG